MRKRRYQRAATHRVAAAHSVTPRLPLLPRALARLFCYATIERRAS